MTKFSMFHCARKGGVGKTFISSNVASGLSKTQSVLFVDVDPQGHGATSYAQIAKPAIYEWFARGKPFASVVTTVTPNLDLLSGDARTAFIDRYLTSAAEIDMQASGQDGNVIAAAVELAKDKFMELAGMNYDHVIFDCPPTQNILVEALIGICDNILIPTSMSPRDVDAVETAINLAAALNPQAEVMVIPNKVSVGGVKPSFDKSAMLQNTEIWNFQGVVVSSPLPNSTQVKAIESTGLSIYEWKASELTGSARTIKAALSGIAGWIAK